MESKDILYKPKDLYNNMLKDQYHQGAEKYFDKLSKDAKVDVEANRGHVKKYNELNDKINTLENTVNSNNAKKIAALVFIIIGFIAGFFLLMGGLLNIETAWYLLLIGIAFIGLSIFLLVYHNKKKKEMKSQEDQLKKLKEEAENWKQVCFNDLKALNDSYDWNIPATIMENVTNIIDLDPFFSIERLSYLIEKFGFKEIKEGNVSVLGVLSGNIQGNPFVLEKLLEEKLEMKRYSGQLTIHWTTYSYGSKGRRVAHHHTQTLTAYASHPAANYKAQTILVYGNEAAPHLHFRHSPSDINSLKTDKEKENAVKTGMKEIQKYADKCIQEGKTFTPMGNDAFDVFFGGLDRDNEVEFRLLFTPLAQNNMLSLLNDPIPYGDDFYMVKDGMVNTICSAHSQNFNYSSDPKDYIGYDIDSCRENFIHYCDQFIQSLYFDLAPLLSIPLYQMHKPREYIYERSLPSNYSSFEQEAMANSLNLNAFAPTGANPNLPPILKVRGASKIGKSDKVSIHAYSYHTTEMVDYVSVRGGDGRYHDVPVHWTKYDRVDSDNVMELKNIGSSRKDFLEKLNEEKLRSLITEKDYVHYERGLLAMKVLSEYDEKTDRELDEIFQEKNI